MSGHFGYVAIVREIELGWGDRPDGAVVVLDKEIGENFVKTCDSFNRAVYPKEWSEAGDFKLCRISDKAKEDIEASEKGVMWVRPREIDDYVLEI